MRSTDHSNSGSGVEAINEAWEFKRYSIPDDVGWLGYLIVLGEVIAFVDLGKRIHFVSELK